MNVTSSAETIKQNYFTLEKNELTPQSENLIFEVSSFSNRSEITHFFFPMTMRLYFTYPVHLCSDQGLD